MSTQRPDLRVIRIRDGSLLDSNAFAMIEEIAKAGDWQVWIEAVQPHSPAAVIMVDGRVYG